MKPQTFWQRLVRAARGYYFVIGSVLVAILVLAAVLGPELAPHNPYQVAPLQWIDGELHKAPFAPGQLYPLGTDDLGRDQLSLLLYGAQTTLIIALVATVIRILLGLLLGTFAGWWPGTLYDRAVTAVTEFLGALPVLILAMLLVFAVGIRRGQIAFIVGLALVGWGEVAQIVRGHVLGMRGELYIEAARSVGLSSAEVLSRHVLPNLLGTLLALAALEMGSALLLLGELGFLQVYIGGGRTGVNMATFDTGRYFDVPDWGAMLGSSWRWFRSYPWFPLAPAAAFFIAILGFNLFGYGMQRFIERGRFHPSGWSVLRFLVIVALVLLGARALLQSAGVEAQYARQVQDYDIERAWTDLEHLVAEGAAADPPDSPAEYIAAQFKAAGLSPASRDGSFFQQYTTTRGEVTDAPGLALLDATGQPAWSANSGVTYDPYQAFQLDGAMEGELEVRGNTIGEGERTGGVLLLLDPAEGVYMPWALEMPFKGILRMVPDEELPAATEAPPMDPGRYLGPESLPRFPNLLIGESAAHDLLAAIDIDLDDLRAQMKAGDEVLIHTGTMVRVSAGLAYTEGPATSVIGYIAGMDRQTEGERILLAADYTTEPRPGAPVQAGADENAGSVAALLETARLYHDLGLIPKRTIVFAVFDEGGGNRFVNSPPLPTGRSDSWTTIILDGVAAGEPYLACAEAGSGLVRAFDESAGRFDVNTRRLDSWRFFFVSNDSRLVWGEPAAHKSYLGLAVTRPGDALSGTAADGLDRLDPELLREAGQAVAHLALVLASR
jgi:peptide/nickel transport system permease protein